MELFSATMNSAPLAIGMPGPTELIIVLIIALLLFGRRLPDVMRSVGRSIVEFKKGVRGIEEDVEEASRNNLNDVKSDVKPPSGSETS